MAKLISCAVTSAILLLPGGAGAADSSNQVTFSRDIAPILFQNCSVCHRPGNAGPFSLLNYADAKKHAREIAEVTAKKIMPPWKPEAGVGEFVGERRLADKQIQLIQQWVESGITEGDEKDLPPAPQFPETWQLGPPDLIVTLPKAYLLPAEGKDVYRNFVIPTSITALKYVSALELRPNNRSVHHAFVKVDRTGQSRVIEARETQPGFPGMSVPAEMPGGNFLNWQPGKRPARSPKGLGWTLNPGDDLVLQLHMNPTGKPETIAPEIGLYFTPEAPTNTTFKISLASLALEIPAGDSNYVVTDSYVLPVDVELLAILPHAHYLAHTMEGHALLPDGRKMPLLLIKNWDFNWQGDYRYVHPISLPSGTTLFMEFSYDNSTHNLRNPSHPPREVIYGPQTTDEMAELWFQLLPRGAEDLEKLSRDYRGHNFKMFLAHENMRLRRNPNDPAVHDGIGQLMFMSGDTQKGFAEFETAVKLNPNFGPAHYHLGLVLQQTDHLPEALMEYGKAIECDKNDFKAHNNLGLILYRQGKLDSAQEHFEQVLRIHPNDSIAVANLELVRQARQNSPKK